MSKDNKIKYETDTPVQGEMREHTISALGKFQKWHEEQRTNMSDIERIIDERMFNYYFNVDSIVELDERVIVKDVETFSFLSSVNEHIGKRGIVKRCYSDLHAFGRGYSYQVDVDFDGDLCKGLPAYYLVEKLNKDE